MMTIVRLFQLCTHVILSTVTEIMRIQSMTSSLISLSKYVSTSMYSLFCFNKLRLRAVSITYTHYKETRTHARAHTYFFCYPKILYLKLTNTPIILF